MDTTTHEIADGVYRLSTFLPTVIPGGLTFNQFLIDGDEPLLFHCGMRSLFTSVSGAAARIIPLRRLRWIIFGHLEADECGAMNQWLAVAPGAHVAQGGRPCEVSLRDLADRPPRPLSDGEVLDNGGHRLRLIPTPHVPHAWDAHVLYDETTSTLFCGDLFTQPGESPAIVHAADIVTPALAAGDLYHGTCLTSATAPTVRRLAGLSPRTLAPMHGPAHAGDCAAALDGLADGYAALFDASAEEVVVR
jgi:flavorubredoxin